MKFVRALKTVVPAAALCFVAAAITVYPERYVEKCLQGFALWAECVLPSLFPFMVITLIFIKTGAAERAALPLKRVCGILRLPPAAAVCTVISVLSGYPAGSRAVREFYDGGCFTAADCRKTAYLCSTSGPLFIIASLGFKMFGDKTAGVKLLCFHLISVAAVGIIVALASGKSAGGKVMRRAPNGDLLYDAFLSAVNAVALAGAFIAFFCVAGQIAVDFNLTLPVEKLITLFAGEDCAEAVAAGLFEMTSGCRALSAAGGKFALPLCGFLVTFGGVSILSQQLCYLIKCKVSCIKFIGVKFLQALLCFFIALIFQ